MASKTISVTRFIRAPQQTIFDLLADPSKHPVMDGSGTVKAPREGNPDRLELGAKFGMNMKIGAPYPITNTVVEFEEGKRIGWCHKANNIWRYELEPGQDGATKVTETFDYSKGRAPAFALKLAGFLKRNEEGMRRTLENIERYLTKSG